MIQSNKFRKSERLSSQKEIQALFSDGHSFHSFPFRVVWKFSDKPDNHLARVVISVPKRKFKKAVDRNLIRRRIKEVYRVQKHILYDHLDQAEVKLIFMLMYTHDEIMDFNELEGKISKLLVRFKQEVKVNT
ncbi:MAG: ribonuclease P protein component [Bacteroidales bacterium]|nr:ribonuclease P protein component [Bacteroidales bacterium]